MKAVKDLLVRVYMCLGLFWLRFNKFLVQATYLAEPTADGFHKAVIIGDGFGEGVCDYVTFGAIAGVMGKLQKLIAFNQTLKLRWKLYNAAKSGTTSADWLPNKPLFKSVFESKAFKDAEIVMIWLGAADGKPGPNHQFAAATVKNLAQICDALKQDGKRVIVAGLPCTGKSMSDDALVAWNGEANKLLQEYITKTKEEDKGSELEGKLSFGPMLQGAMYSRDDLTGIDQEHFNSSGYKLAAKDLHEILQIHMKAVEWGVFKNKLAPSSAQDKSESKKSK